MTRTMISCAICGRPLQECCDIYVEAIDRWTGADVVICGSCVDVNITSRMKMKLKRLKKMVYNDSTAVVGRSIS